MGQKVMSGNSRGCSSEQYLLSDQISAANLGAMGTKLSVIIEEKKIADGALCRSLMKLCGR